MSPTASVTAPRRPRPNRRRGTVSRGLARAKRSAVPEDRALYTCGCGHAFKAAVTTSVGCPRCGSGQAW